MTGAPRIAVLDYGMGNRRSVQKALEHVGAEAEITRDLDQIATCAGLVLPGVGAFPTAMRNLQALGLDVAVRGVAADERPVLGICLGMQLLFGASEEFALTPGLGLIPGRVTPLQTAGRRFPHIGWNDVRFDRESPLSAGLPPEGAAFYHVHSLAARPVHPEDVLGSTEYGERFATIVRRANVFGVQFHPEKSSAHGLRMLANFARLCGTAARASADSSAAGSAPVGA